MTNNKEISEGTTINLKMSHLFAFLGGLVAILVTVIGFFYGMLNSSIDKKVEKEIYTIEKKYLDEKDASFNSKLDEINSEVTSTNKSLQTMGIDIASIKAKQNSSTLHQNSMNSTPTNNSPNRPNF